MKLMVSCQVDYDTKTGAWCLEYYKVQQRELDEFDVKQTDESCLDKREVNIAFQFKFDPNAKRMYLKNLDLAHSKFIQTDNKNYDVKIREPSEEPLFPPFDVNTNDDSIINPEIPSEISQTQS